DINGKDKYGEYPFFCAVDRNNIDIVKLIINYAVKKNRYGEYPFLWAIGNNNIEIVKLIIDYANEHNILLDINGKEKLLENYFDLISACKNENEKAIKRLVKEGTNANAENEIGDTPLSISCEKGNLSIIKYLIENGAETDKCNSTGNSPLNLLCKIESEKSLKIINYLIKNAKVDINFKDKNGNTPLLMASYFRNNEIILKLIENGADPNIQNNFGNTPLIVSYYFKNEKIIQELKKKGADMSIKNKYGENYLSIA
ncbi:ankyrin, partial [Neocallimastix californiae]